MPLFSRPSGKLAGIARVPGDRLLSHGGLILGALAVGRTSIKGLADSVDVRATAAALRALGATVTRHADGLWTIDGVGVGGLGEPDRVLDLGSCGIGLHLLLGLVATHPITALFTGDTTLARQPLARLVQPLRMMGAEFTGRHGTLLPLAVTGAALPMPIDYIAGADVKPALLLAALNTPGTSVVTEAHPGGDGLERLLPRFGARIRVEAGRVELDGQPELTPAALDLAGDPSLGLLPLVAALVVPGSEIILSPLDADTGSLAVLRDMGADIAPVSDGLRVRASALTGFTLPAGLAEDAPILAVAAAYARGTTVLAGLDPGMVDGLAHGLAACGVPVAVDGDTLSVTGSGGPVPGGAAFPGNLDRRIARAFLVLGLGARAAVSIGDAAALETDFPDFAGLMRGLGADISAGTN